MKRFFEKIIGIFKNSLNEIAGKNKVMCIVVTGLLLAISMAIETFTIEIPFAKINFAFLAIAAIGMFYGPIVAFFAGGICDILGYIVHPDGAFIPTYIFVAMLQGLIYGIVLYRKWGNMSAASIRKSRKITEFTVRVVTARLLDIIIINLFVNTALNMHYGFIPKQAFVLAVHTRLIKNLLQLAADIPLMIIILPALLIAYNGMLQKDSTAA